MEEKEAAVIWGSESIRITYAGDHEEDLWKPVGEIIAASDIGENEVITVAAEGDGYAKLIMDSNGIRAAENRIRLKRSRYKTVKLRKIDPASGTHMFYDLVPNNMGPRTLDVGARYGQTGGTNAGADFIEGAYVLKSPMPSHMFWVKYHMLLRQGYKDFTDELCDEDEEIRRLEKLFEEPEPEWGDEDETVLRVNDYLENASRQALSSKIDIDFLSGKPPFTRRQVSSAWKEWNKFKTCAGARDANEVILRLLAITDVSFKDGKNRKTVASFLIKETGNKEEEKKKTEECIDMWETLIRSMEAVLPPPEKTENGEKAVKLSPFGNIEMEMAGKEETLYYLRKFRVPDGFHCKVVNVKAPDFMKRFDDYCKGKGITILDEFLHGSSTANWKSIIMNGLSLNPDAPVHGKAYGYGIYTARDFVKSLGYTDFRGSKWAGGKQNTGVIGIYRAAYGKPMFPESGRFGEGYEKDVLKGGYDCLDAKAEYSGYLMDEIVFYNEAALVLIGLIMFSGNPEDLKWLA